MFYINFTIHNLTNKTETSKKVPNRKNLRVLCPSYCCSDFLSMTHCEMASPLAISTPASCSTNTTVSPHETEVSTLYCHRSHLDLHRFRNFSDTAGKLPCLPVYIIHYIPIFKTKLSKCRGDWRSYDNLIYVLCHLKWWCINNSHCDKCFHLYILLYLI